MILGKGVIGFVTDTANESFQITKGDVVRVPSSVTHFFANTNGTVPLRLAKIAVPANVPGHFQVLYLILLHLNYLLFWHLINFNIMLFVNVVQRRYFFQVFFPAHSGFHQSYFTGFSKDVLTASFNVRFLTSFHLLICYIYNIYMSLGKFCEFHEMRYMIRSFVLWNL